MDPQAFLKLLRRWVLIVVGFVAVGGILAFGFSHALKKSYKAQGLVLVVQAPRTAQGGAFTLTANQVTSTYATLMTQQPILQGVIAKQHLPETPDELSRKVTVTPQRDTELLDVSVSDADPQRAAKIANGLMEAFVAKISNDNQIRIGQAGSALNTEIQDLQTRVADDSRRLAVLRAEKGDVTGLENQIQGETALLTQLTNNYSSFRAQQAQSLDAVNIGAPASAPVRPDSPKTTLNVIFGALAGLVLGIGAVSLTHYFDQGLRTEEDVRKKLGMVTLAVIPRLDEARQRSDGRGRAAAQAAESLLGAGEAYRRLRTSVMFSGVDRELRSITMTSARAGEGKTLTAANFAAAVAAAGAAVVLVDADMRRPRQHTIFEESLSNGLSELLLRSRDSSPTYDEAIRTTATPALSLITAGTIPPNPSELLAAKYVPEVILGLERKFDLVVFDTPPIGVVTDACGLASRTTATVIVVEAGKTSARQVQTTLAILQGVGATVIGIVLNKARQSKADPYYGYYEADPGGDAPPVESRSYRRKQRVGSRAKAPADAAAMSAQARERG